MSAGAVSMHSDLWHRVASLRPRLRPETMVERHVLRGQVWYVASDRFSTRTYRFTPAVWSVLMRMDGRRTLDRIWREVAERAGADAPAQDHLLGVVAQLFTAELISSDRPVDMHDIAERAETFMRRSVAQRYRNPMFLRVPLFNPDSTLSSTLHLVSPFCGPLGGVLWLAAMVWFAVEAGLHWTELTKDVTDRVLAADGLLVFLLTFPPLKVLHELGHAYAIKLFGGAVHEIGISFLTFMPAPYVDASATDLFPSRWHRVIVGAAGMMVELAVAAVALAVWLAAEPGLMRSVAFDVIFIASVSTVIFNANPLLRFDGYYIVTDALGLPNLAARSQRIYLSLAQRQLFGLRSVKPTETAPGERFWLLLYAPASFVYRMVVVVGIALFIGTQYFFFGVALVAWMLVTTIVWPLVKGMRYVLLSPALAKRRLRALAVIAGTLVLLVGGIAFIPIPYGTVAQGVVWIPDDARVTAAVSGDAGTLLVQPGSQVEAGAPLLQLSDPFIASKRASAEARLAELEARLAAVEPHSAYEAQLTRSQIGFAKDDLAETVRRQAALTVKSPRGGTFLVPKSDSLVGSFVKQGDTIGYVMSGSEPMVRAAVPEGDIDLVRSRVKSVAVRLEGSILQDVEGARVAREFPAATRRLPSQALASGNGGPFALDPTDKDQNTALLPFFTVDVSVPSDLVRDHWGERAWVRFDHGASPMLERWWRSARQVFLGRFHV